MRHLESKKIKKERKKEEKEISTPKITERNKHKKDPNTVQSCFVLSSIVLSCLVLPCLALARLVFSCLVVPCLAFPCLVLPCFVFLVLFCLVLLIDLVARCFSMIPWAAPYPTRFGKKDEMRERMNRECWFSIENRKKDEDERGSHRLVSCMFLSLRSKNKEIFAVSEMLNGISEDALVFFGLHERNMRSLLILTQNQTGPKKTIRFGSLLLRTYLISH